MKIKKTIKIKGVETSVHLRDGHGPAIVCIPGNSMSKKSFEALFANEAIGSFPLVTYDLPGHGNSAVPPAPETVYSHEGYFLHLKSLITALELDEVILLGVSLGGHIAVGSAGRGLPALRGLFIIGAPPVAGLSDFPNAFNPLPENTSFFSDELTDKQIQFWVDALSADSKIKERCRSDIRHTYPQSRSFLLNNMSRLGYNNEQEIFRSLEIPFRVAIGASDRLLNLNFIYSNLIKELMGERLLVLDGCEHLPVWDKDDPYLIELEKFMEQFIV